MWVIIFKNWKSLCLGSACDFWHNQITFRTKKSLYLRQHNSVVFQEPKCNFLAIRLSLLRKLTFVLDTSLKKSHFHILANLELNFRI